MKKKFVAAVTCMDGRIQSSINAYLRDKYDVPYVDVISEPGPNRILAEANDDSVIENIKKRLDISIHKHGAEIIALVGHEDCAGNPVYKEAQREDTLKGIDTLASMNFKATVVGLWVSLAGNVEVIGERRCGHVS